MNVYIWCLILVSNLAGAEVLHWEKPSVVTYEDCLKYELPEAQTRNISLQSVRQQCTDIFINQMKTWKKNLKDQNVINYVSHLLRGIYSDMNSNRKRKKRSLFDTTVYLRREIREPPYDKVWGCFDRGVRRLKHLHTIRPDMNNYDVIASLHIADKVIPTAHDGPGFFAWHRHYLKIMELAIGCPIPYWDLTFDAAMDDPTLSRVWTDRYFGTGYGLVTNGIMKHLPSPFPVIRNINAAGWLISKSNVEMAMAKPSLHQFTEVSPCYTKQIESFSWECFHKGVHDWIDGTMAPSNTTTFDPLFFTYHAFVDKIFERFRQKLKSWGIDPSDTYPNKDIKGHGPDHKTIWVDVYPGLERLTNRECYGDELASLTEYSVGPLCPHCSYSDDLYCNETVGQCVSKTKFFQSTVESPTAKVVDGKVVFVSQVEEDNPDRVNRLMGLVGELPFGKKFKIGTRDNRTRNDAVAISNP